MGYIEMGPLYNEKGYVYNPETESLSALVYRIISILGFRTHGV